MDQPAPLIRLFRPGTFTSNEGSKLSFTEADLVAAVEAYDPQGDPAPLVIGHPQINDPAYGWVRSLSVKDGELIAEPERIDASFAEAVRAGRYGKVSAQFYLPDDPSNPKPGAWYLRHIGFLGAKAPGVKGLGRVAFAAAEDGVATFDFAQTQETRMPEAPDAATLATLASFAERENALTAREAEIAAREQKIADEARQARKVENASFAEGLVKDARLAPAGKGLVAGLLDVLGELPATASFSEGGNELSAVAAFKKLFDNAAPIVSLGELGKKPAGEGARRASFATYDGYTVDPEQAELHARAKAIQAEKPDLSFMDCVRLAQA